MPCADTRVQSLLGWFIANNSLVSGANHPGSPPTIHQRPGDEACGVLAADVGLSQSVVVSCSMHRRGEEELSEGEAAATER